MMTRSRYLIAFIAYIVIAFVVIGHPPSALLDQFIGNDIGDNYEMARNIWWFTFAIEKGEPLFYQTWLGYPDGINGAILMSLPLQYFPMWGLAFFLPLHVAYNFTIVFWMALNGWALFFLMRYLLSDTDEWVVPFIAGIVYLAFPLFQGHLAEGHGGLMVAWAVPLYVWALFRYTSTEKNLWQWLLACILFFYLSTTGHILQSIYVLIPVTGTFLLGKLWLRDWRSVKRIMGMGILASMIMLAVLAPAILDATADNTYSSVGGFTRFSADLLAIVSPSFLHPVFDNFLAYPRQVNGTNLGEGLAYIGIIGALASIIGLWKRQESRWWLLLAAIAWIASLGSVLKVFDTPLLINGNTIPLPFALVQDLPGFNLARTPARFNFTFALAIAVLVGYGLSWLWQQREGNWRYLLAVLVATGILWEYQSFWGQPLRPASVPDAITDLREDETIRAIFNIPYQHALAAKDALYLQTAHEQPLIAGQITRTTPVNPAKLAMLQATLDPALLDTSGADIVILHHARASEIGVREELEARANEQLGDPVYRDERIAIYRVPENSESASLDYTIDREATTLSGGISLVGQAIFEWENQHTIWLQWQFEQSRPDTDVRFLHILDESGEIVLQDDSSLGQIKKGDVRTDLLVFDTGELDSGAYTIRTGWYDFNTLTNYTTDEGDAAIILGEFTR